MQKSEPAKMLKLELSGELYSTLQRTATNLKVSMEDLAEWAILTRLFRDDRLAAPSKVSSERFQKAYDKLARRKDLLESIISAGWNRFRHPGRKGIPRRCYIIGRLRKTEMEKVKRWLQDKNSLEVSTHSEQGQLYVFNRSLIDDC